MKKLVSALLMLVFAFSLSVCAFAANASSDDSEQYILSTGIYEGEALEACAEMLGYEMVTDDGYSLQSISVSYEENNDQSVVTEEPSAAPNALGDHIGDVKKVASDRYFPDNPIASNWYDGPLTKLTKTYSRSVAGTYTCSASVSASTVNAGLSFSVTDSVSESTTLERPAISSSQKLNVKEFGVYDKYSFTLYGLLGDQKGTGYAYKPMGLYVTQAIYSK